MLTRMVAAVALILLLTSPVSAREKKKTTLPNYVLEVHTAAVIINPESETPLANPGENRTAQDDVERALMKWGRLQPVIDTGTADLVILVRRGRAMSPTLGGGPPNDRPIIIQPDEGGVRVGVQSGTPPRTTSGPHPRESGPRLGTESASAEALFEVYRGGVQYPLDSAPVWRYVGKNALQPPTVPAVLEFRKAIEEAEKQQKKKP